MRGGRVRRATGFQEWQRACSGNGSAIGGLHFTARAPTLVLGDSPRRPPGFSQGIQNKIRLRLRGCRRLIPRCRVRTHPQLRVVMHMTLLLLDEAPEGMRVLGCPEQLGVLRALLLLHRDAVAHGPKCERRPTRRHHAGGIGRRSGS
jgi:hypothetical protein